MRGLYDWVVIATNMLRAYGVSQASSSEVGNAGCVVSVHRSTLTESMTVLTLRLNLSMISYSSSTYIY